MEITDSFGYWVRRRRKALDLTQDELALRVGCAVITLRKIEADERRPSPQMADRLAHSLQLSSIDRPRFIAAALGEQAIGRMVLPAAPAGKKFNNLPAPATHLIGRTAELTLISDLIGRDEARLVTLTGPVGIGKTRMAIEAGRLMIPLFRDGVYLVSLALVEDAILVPSATSRALGIREAPRRDPAQSVVEFLAEKTLLLIFDNFEHLLPASLFLSILLADCPALRILVTSRARLHLYGEHEYQVPPLQLSNVDDHDAAAGAPAVQLFCERARSARPDFQLSPDLVPIISAMCHHLDGLPLAIELAAARLRLFSPQELQKRLERRLPLLTQTAAGLPQRMQGLEAAIAWSYGLLSPAQRTLLARAAVFVGSFNHYAAEAVCAFPFEERVFPTGHTVVMPPPDIGNGLDALLDHSLLHRDASSVSPSASPSKNCEACPRRMLCTEARCETRFSMLEIIREFAFDQLRVNNELDIVRRRHAEFFSAWAEEATSHLHGPDQAIWLERLEMEVSNLRAALTWLLASGDVALAAGLACTLGEFWQRHGYYSEGRRWLQQILSQLEQTTVPEALRARTLQTAAMLTYRQRDRAGALRLLGDSLALYRELPDLVGQARVYFDLGWIAIDQENWTDAIRLNQESLALAREVDDPYAMYQALTNLGWAHLCTGEQSAETVFEEAHELAKSIGHTKGVAVSLANLAWIALRRGDWARSINLAQDSLRLCHLLGEREVMAECLEILAFAELIRGDAPRAAFLRNGASSLWDMLDIAPPTEHLVGIYGLRVDPAHPAMSGDDRERDRPSRRSLDLDVIVYFALECGELNIHLAHA